MDNSTSTPPQTTSRGQLFLIYLSASAQRSRCSWSSVADDVTERLDDLVHVLFLPAFFAFTGMRIEIGLMTTWQDWAMRRRSHLRFRAPRLGRAGILMNTRGLVELIVLNIGLDLRVLSPRLFTMLVIMALVTTFMTGPALNVLMRGHTWDLQPQQEPIRTV